MFAGAALLASAISASRPIMYSRSGGYCAPACPARITIIRNNVVIILGPLLRFLSSLVSRTADARIDNDRESFGEYQTVFGGSLDNPIYSLAWYSLARS